MDSAIIQITGFEFDVGFSFIITYYAQKSTEYACLFYARMHVYSECVREGMRESAISRGYTCVSARTQCCAFVTSVYRFAGSWYK